MQKNYRKQERGIALVMALLALMLLSAIAIGMMFVSSTETAISSNFRSEETAYFAARAGVEEVRDRMLPFPPSPSASYSINALLPTAMPGAGNPWALYILNGKNQSGSNLSMTDVTGFAAGNQLVDDELCHDFYNANTGMTYQSANVKCTDLPANSAWYGNTFVQSLTPVGGNSNPVDYKWIRITLKANNTYAGNNPNTNLLVDPSQAGTHQVCWSGSGGGAHEIVIASGTTCLSANAMPVYLVTSLALTPSGARRMVQQEVAQTFVPYNVPGGMFAAGAGCSALTIAGNAQTGSFDSANENPATDPPSNLANNGGDVGSNGNVSLGGSSSNVHGHIKTNQPASVGNCPGNGVTVSGHPGYQGIDSSPVYNPSVPPTPNPLPPTGNVTWKNVTEPAGSYGNVTVEGTVSLTGGTSNNPAIFTMNSLIINGGGTLQINGYVVLNLAGVSTPTVLDMTGGGFVNTSYVPSAFVINYGGTDSMTITGGTAAYSVINAPNSAITLRGGSNFYGAIIGNTISDQGGTNFYWDKSLQLPPPSNTTTFHDVALRELSY